MRDHEPRPVAGAVEGSRWSIPLTLDPAKDINWVTSADRKPIELVLDGKVDAFLRFPPEPQRRRAKNIGNVIGNSAQDRPWSQYFCCVLAGNPDFNALAELATRWRVAGHFGVGIAHGYATLGAIGFEGRSDYSAIGTEVTLAVRLCAEAGDGHILVYNKVRVAIENTATLEPAGNLALKGTASSRACLLPSCDPIVAAGPARRGPTVEAVNKDRQERQSAQCGNDSLAVLRRRSAGGGRQLTLIFEPSG
jgi:hypothetical protein